RGARGSGCGEGAVVAQIDRRDPFLSDSDFQAAHPHAMAVEMERERGLIRLEAKGKGAGTADGEGEALDHVSLEALQRLIRRVAGVFQRAASGRALEDAERGHLPVCRVDLPDAAR